MAAASREPAQVDLSLFSTAECARIWEVLQKDFRLRFRENQRLQRLKSQLAKAGEKALLLGKDPDFNERYCIVCFGSFIFLFNPKTPCFVCSCNACRSCRRYLSNRDKWICRLCEDEKVLAAKQCSWFYDGGTKRFVVGGNHSSFSGDAVAEDLKNDPMAEQMRHYLQGFVARYKQGDGQEISFEEEMLHSHRDRRTFAEAPGLGNLQDISAPDLKRITAHQVMRFQQKISVLSSEVEAYLRENVRYEMLEPGLDPAYDEKMESFRLAIANILRTFSQTLYIAIEGHRSKTGQPVSDIHAGVHQILQDEVENLVGHRVDFPTDDDAISTTSEDVGSRFNEQGLTIHEKLTDILLGKWLVDHQNMLEDRHMSASDAYAETALERVLARKAACGVNFGELPGDLGRDPDLASTQGSHSSSHSGSNWLLKGRPATNCGSSLRGLGNGRTEKNKNFTAERSFLEEGDFDSEHEDAAASEDEEQRRRLTAADPSLPTSSPTSSLAPRKTSNASLDFDAVYRQNLDHYEKTTPLQQSSRSEDSGVHVNSSPPGSGAMSELERRFSLGFAKMDWSLSEQSDPRFIAKKAEVAAEEGECALIGVEVAGTEPIDLFWYRCSSAELLQLEEGPRIEFATARDHPGKHCLLLWHLRKQDEGEFLAVAVNENGSCKLGFKVTVRPRQAATQAPEFSREVADEGVRRGETARLNCRVLGSPAPRVTFEREGMVLKDSRKVTITRIGNNSFSLAIHDFQPEDEGRYCCLATNCAGKVRCTANVRILHEDIFSANGTQPGVDSSPAVKVSAQISRLSSNAGSSPPTLFRDRIEPLVRESVNKEELAGKMEGRRRRGVRAAPAERERKKEERKEKMEEEEEEEEFLPDIDVSEFELKADSAKPQRLECGLKRVGSHHRKNFFVNRSPDESAARAKKEKEERERREKRRGNAAKSGAPMSEPSPSLVSEDGEGAASGFSGRRAGQQADTVSDIRTLIESGRMQSSFTPNMFASFRKRKFPSVPKLRDNFSGPSSRGSYPKMEPAQEDRGRGQPRSVVIPKETRASSSPEDFRQTKPKSTARGGTKR